MEAKIIKIFDEKFDNIKQNIPANATENDIYEIIREKFYDIAEEIEDEYPTIIDTETDENERWFDEYFNIIVPDWFEEIKKNA